MTSQSKIVFGVLSLIILLLCVCTNYALACENKEHRLLADSALAAVLTGFRSDTSSNSFSRVGMIATFWVTDVIYDKKTFGELCEFFSNGDMSRSRFHNRGETILQQLRLLSPELIRSTWIDQGISGQAKDASLGGLPRLRSVEQSDKNVAVNYLVHHLLALRAAQIAGKSTDGIDTTALKRALVFEAMAMSYLCDAFSAGHLLVPVNDCLSRFHCINNRKPHDFYCTKGVYVVNSRGEVWQTFGDQPMLWYMPTYRHVLQACVTSLRELFLVYCVSVDNDSVPKCLKEWWASVSPNMSPKQAVDYWTTPQSGEEYYTVAQMPSLMLLPMAVSATWSVRTETIDDHGIHVRKHCPQFCEQGFHDPDLEGIDSDFLYSKAAVPAWMVPAALAEKDPKTLITNDTTFASVRYVQERHFAPSYAGLFLSAGGAVVAADGDLGSGWAAGLGWGFIDKFLIMNNLSANLTLLPAFGNSRRLMISTSAGLGIALPHFTQPVLHSFHLEGGYAWGLGQPLQSHGAMLAVGLDAPTIPLGFTYMGITVRAKFQRIWQRKAKDLNGVLLEFILH